MEYIALYRKWRPMTFDEVVEQGSVVTILKNTVKSKRIAHAYLFCGTRGTGKTTLAKIFSRAINCLAPQDGNPCNQCEICKGILSDTLLDVSEIDAASNNGVDNIRAIIEESAYSASKAEYKVFIIDEVHMLTQQAFNALLKTLEEPPENVVFILATTEPHKLPVTILSRCQRYDFKRISRDGIVSRLEEICHNLEVDYEEAALKFIAGKADGALRDAISILDQTLASASNGITLKDARASSGSLDRETIELFAEKLILCDGSTILTLTDKIFSDGRDPSNFICELIDLLRGMMIVLSVRSPGSLLVETGEDLDRLKKLAALTNLKELAMMIKELSSLENSLKWSVQRKILFEAGMLSLCDRNWGKDTALQDRVQYLEQHLADLVANGLKVAAISAPSGTGLLAGETPPSAPGTAAPEHPPVPEIPETEETEEFDLSTLTPVDEMDWQDFLSAISDKKKQGISSGIRVHAKGYLIGHTLYIVFSSKTMMDITCRRDCVPLLKECASVAFGRPLSVAIETKENFEAKAPQLVTEGAAAVQEENEEDKAFDNALNLLKQMSEVQGFTVSENDPAVNPDAEGMVFSVKSASDTENADSGKKTLPSERRPDFPAPEASAPSPAAEESSQAEMNVHSGDEPDFEIPPPTDDDIPPDSDFDEPDPDRDAFSDDF